jgi:hypothetical protein
MSLGAAVDRPVNTKIRGLDSSLLLLSFPRDFQHVTLRESIALQPQVWLPAGKPADVTHWQLPTAMLQLPTKLEGDTTTATGPFVTL